ncbi:MAG: hypothetical protein K5873_06960 [Treponema sp.]|nr:hypothetical protein [Treponema sp.]
MDRELQKKIHGKKEEIIQSFIELSELFSQDEEFNQKYDYSTIIKLLKKSKDPDTSIQIDLFGLLASTVDSWVERWKG